MVHELCPLPRSCRNVSWSPRPQPGSLQLLQAPLVSEPHKRLFGRELGRRHRPGLHTWAHLPTSCPSLLCKEGTGQFSRILYLGMAAGFKCVSGLWQRSRRIVKQILPEPSKPGEGTGGIGRVQGRGASPSSVFHQSGPGSLLASGSPGDPWVLWLALSPGQTQAALGADSRAPLPASRGLSARTIMDAQMRRGRRKPRNQAPQNPLWNPSPHQQPSHQG